MPTRATRSAILLAAACATATLAAPAQAQTGAPAVGQRYMSWAGRPATTTPASVIAAEAQAQGQSLAQVDADPAQPPRHRGVIPRRVAPTLAVSRPTMQPTPTPQRVSRGPTPASAWLDPQPVPAFAPGAPDPIAYTRQSPTPVAAADTTSQPAWVPTPAPPPRAAQPGNQPATVVAASPTPQAAPPAATDPMAPRADALIFRLRPQTALQPTAAQTDQAQPQVYAEAAAPPAAPVPARPGQQTSRYYSVHREAGHAPDRTPLPEAVFYDSVALDLAEPPETQPPLRDSQGRLRPPVRDEDPERP